MNAFSNRLTANMSNFAMKNKTLAMLLGIDEKTVSKWTTGTDFPDEFQIFEIARIFGDDAFKLTDMIDEARDKARMTQAYEYLIKRVRNLAPHEAVALYERLLAEEESKDAAKKPQENKTTDFGKAVKIRLVEIDKDQEWLIERVKEETGDYFDSSYLHRILTGKISAEIGYNGKPGKVKIIRKILGMEE